MVLLSSTELTTISPTPSSHARFAGLIGIPEKIGFAFGLLSVSTFILTTLDTATRIARFTFSELLKINSRRSHFWITGIIVAVPLVFAFLKFYDLKGNPIPAWKAIWPVFGASNQLLAALTFLVIAVWLKRRQKNLIYVLGPLFLMLLMSCWALILLLKNYALSAVGIIAFILIVLALLLVREAVEILFSAKVG